MHAAMHPEWHLIGDDGNMTIYPEYPFNLVTFDENYPRPYFDNSTDRSIDNGSIV